MLHLMIIQDIMIVHIIIIMEDTIMAVFGETDTTIIEDTDTMVVATIRDMTEDIMSEIEIEIAGTIGITDSNHSY
ncbi:MAG: hypothetical protein IE885_08175, partial [Campylobacterales bacterium]|nr:hypothetical protein [Campylobacterales bacterium]